jgi:uncharacterized protein (TIGR02246 family)
MRRARLVTAVFVLLSSVTGLRAQNPAPASAEQEVIAAEHGWVDAALAHDANAFAAYVADEYVELVPGARTVDKETWVKHIRSGNTKYESVEIHNLVVHVYGNTAVVIGDFSQKATSAGKDRSATGKYVNTWVKRDNRWQVVASGFSTTPTSALH